MIIKFNNHYLEKLFENRPVTGKPKYANDVIRKFKKAVLKLQFADNIRELRNFKGMNFEALKGEWKGFYSVRVDIHYRLILSVEADRSVTVTEILIIEDLSKHYQKNSHNMAEHKILNSKGKEIFTDVSLHPGEVLAMELEARGMRKSAFAENLGMKPSHFSELLHSKRHISAAIALKLEKLLDIPAEYWMRIQVYYDLFMERNKEAEAA